MVLTSVSVSFVLADFCVFELMIRVGRYLINPINSPGPALPCARVPRLFSPLTQSRLVDLLLSDLSELAVLSGSASGFTWRDRRQMNGGEIARIPRTWVLYR